jgi:DNA-binding beta-propeller fold protein YncE
MMLASVIALALAPQVAQIEPRLQTQIGSADGPLEAVFGRVPDLATDPDGNVYVLDESADRVRVFTASGRYLRTFGRRGRNPGELNRPLRIDVRGEVVTVLNPSGQASSFTLNGGPIPDASLPIGGQ